MTNTNQDGVEQLRTFKLPATESKFTVYGLGEKERRRVVAIQPEKELGGSLLAEPNGDGKLTMRPPRHVHRRGRSPACRADGEHRLRVVRRRRTVPRTRPEVDHDRHHRQGRPARKLEIAD
jgi:hypothetical protein